jgi:hypothetical protein
MRPNNRSTKTDQLLKRAPVRVHVSNAPIALDGEENPFHEKPEIDPAMCWQALHSRDRCYLQSLGVFRAKPTAPALGKLPTKIGHALWKETIRSIERVEIAESERNQS